MLRVRDALRRMSPNVQIRDCGVVISFDALGTLCTFKQPVAQQYLQVARRCGLRGVNNVSTVSEAFRQAFREANNDFPNYGKGRLDSPQQWWESLVHRTFSKIVPADRIPPDLGSEMYAHFSSGAAYQLLPGVVEELCRIKQLKSIPAWDADSQRSFRPTVLCCVITNSDPRIVNVLQDLGLKIGTVEPQRVALGTALPGFLGGYKTVENDYDVTNDFDFVCTSYEAESEKPDSAIFDYAEKLAEACFRAWEHRAGSLLHKLEHSARKSIELSWKTTPDRALWMHVGDDLEKDVRGALNAGIRPMYLDRHGKDVEGKREVEARGGLVRGSVTGAGVEAAALYNTQMKVEKPATNRKG